MSQPNRIDATFAALRKEKRKGLVIFLTAGDPSLTATPDLVIAAREAGADLIELGIPFSDPLADGPVIQESFYRAIGKGTTLTRALAMTASLRNRCDVPLVYMLASTLVIHHGTARFMKEAAAAGVDGLILPDVPVDESPEFAPEAAKRGLATVQLAAPTSPAPRLKKIARASSGFVYYVNVTGVTGRKAATPSVVGARVRQLKGYSKTPVCAGFGISTPAQAKAIARVCDGIIIGSAAVRIVAAAKSRKAAVADLTAYIRSIRRALDSI